MTIDGKIINNMAIKKDGFYMICDSCKHLYTGECDPKCESLSGFESIAKSLVAELVELRQTRNWKPISDPPQPFTSCLVYESLPGIIHESWYFDGEFAVNPISNSGDCWGDRITHWMPCPHAPESDG